jgi:DNA polymerase III delta subunit
LQAELDAGRLRSVYLVTSAETEGRGRYEEKVGADPQTLLAVAARIEQAALLGGDRDLDHVKIDYLDGDHQATGTHDLISLEARSMSMFGLRRVITVVHADGLNFGENAKASKKAKAEVPHEDSLEKLLNSFDSSLSNPPCVVIFIAEHLSRASRVCKAIGRAGAIVEVPPLTIATLQQYFETEASPWRITIERGVAQKVWDRLGGADPARLRQTADRLLLDAGPNGTVSIQSVEATVPMDREAAIFALTDAIAAQDPLRAVTVLHLMLEHVPPTAREEEVNKIVGFLSSQFQLLIRIQGLLQRGMGEGDIAAETGKSPSYIRNLCAQVRGMRQPGRLEDSLGRVADMEAIVRGTQLGDRKAATARWLEQSVLCLTRGTPVRLPSIESVFDIL